MQGNLLWHLEHLHPSYYSGLGVCRAVAYASLPSFLSLMLLRSVLTYVFFTGVLSFVLW